MEIFGDFVENRTCNQEYLQISFSPSSISLQQRWRNNGLSADFLADYLSTFFPGTTDRAQEKQAEIKDAVSYLANELLENAMKFNYAPEQNSISLIMCLMEDCIRFYVTNGIDPQTIPQFQKFIQELFTEDTDELYMRKLMANSEEEGGRADDVAEEIDRSGLGYLTMVNDYGAKLAWKFDEPNQNDCTTIATTTVTIMVELAV